MSELWLKRTLVGFAPDGDEAASDMRRIPVGTSVRCEITRPRSVKQLRYYWALCALVASNHAELQTREKVDQALRLATGHVDLIRVGSVTYKVPARIAFSRLSQDEWQAYLLRAKDAVLTHLLPGVEFAEFEAEIARMAS